MRHPRAWCASGLMLSSCADVLVPPAVRRFPRRRCLYRQGFTLRLALVPPLS